MKFIFKGKSSRNVWFSKNAAIREQLEKGVGPRWHGNDGVITRTFWPDLEKIGGEQNGQINLEGDVTIGQDKNTQGYKNQ